MYLSEFECKPTKYNTLLSSFQIMVLCLLLIAQSAEARINRSSQNPIPEPVLLGELKVELEDIALLPHKLGEKLANRVNYLFHAGDSSGRLFVNDMSGQVFIVNNKKILPEPFIDVEQIIGSDFLSKEKELGLGSFAFHPDYTRQGQQGFGKFYTVHTENKSTLPDSPRVRVFNRLGQSVHHFDVMTEWTVFESDKNRIDPESRREVLRIAQPSWDNNTGQIAFNPNAKPGDDDYGNLYLGVGDGGNAEEMMFAVLDANSPGQDLKTPLGAILRINPLRRGIYRYSIPTDNPFVNDQKTLPEIWAYGFRNPQRFSWDSGATEKMLTGDIGHANIEEINLGKAGGNYGWSRREGSFEVNRVVEEMLYQQEYDNGETELVDPVLQYDHDEGKAIVAGFVYRGTEIPDLNGMFVFGDIVNGRIFYVDIDQLIQDDQVVFLELTLMKDNRQTNLLEIMGDLPRADLRFGMDEQGELYVLTKQDGFIRKISRYTGVPAMPEVSNPENESVSESNPEKQHIFLGGKAFLKGAGLMAFFLIAILSVIALKVSRRQKIIRQVRDGQIESANGWYYFDSKVSRCILGINTNRNILEMIPYGKLTRIARIKLNEIDYFNVIAYGISILKISWDGEEDFDEDNEELLRDTLNTFESEPMRPHEERSIELNIMGKPDAGFQRKVNFYFREGRIRKTTHSFQETIDDLIYWCKLLSIAIKPDREK